MPKHVFERETVIFNGIEFRRYPNSSKSSDRNYFRPGSAHIRAGVQTLHREIWKAAYGAIPDGYDIHHKDENPLNNNLDNLECLSKSDHAARHAESMTEWRKQWIAEGLNKHARPAAIDWHKSEAGREWHSANSKHAAAMWKAVDKTCEWCSKSYTARGPAVSKFCSNNCKSAARRASGADRVTRQCLHCHADFSLNKYNKTRFCSNSCCTKYHWNKPDTKYK